MLLGALNGTAQDTKPELLAALNEQMWLPFLEGVRTDHSELYVGIHAEDFYWVAPGSKGRIMNLKEYDDDSRMVMERRMKTGATTGLQVRFLERNINTEFASEKAVVKFTLYKSGQPAETSYAIVHYFSRKENGKWKMWMQFGSAEKASAEIYENAVALEEVDRF